MDLGIAGRTALVGGASSGLGRAVAECLVDEGCHLAIWARGEDALRATAEELGRRSGRDVPWIVADAADPGSARLVAEEASATLGPLDIVVLNAGGPPPRDPTATDPEGWRRAFQLLAITPIELATLALPSMRERRWGRIVAILSSGVRQPIPDLAYSNAGRSALMAWLKTTARAVAADGVTLNGVLPGRLDTPRIESLDRGRSTTTGRPLDDIRESQLAAIPARRYGRPAELGSLVAYLCSEQAGYQTGTFTAVDGGLIAGLP